MGDRIPAIVIDILEANGFDHALAVKQINTENIELIECNTTDNLGHILKDSIYENISNFRFLPGHKVSILALPELVDKYNSQKQPKVNSVENIEEIEVLSEEKKYSLAKTLIKKIEVYAVKVNLDDINLPAENVSSIDTCINRAGAVSYKCTVKCPACEVKIPCLYNKNWQISNLENHLKVFHANKKSPNENQSEDQATISTEKSDAVVLQEKSNEKQLEEQAREQVKIHVEKSDAGNVILPKESNAAELSVLLNEDDLNDNESDKTQNSIQDDENAMYITLNESMINALSLHNSTH